MSPRRSRSVERKAAMKVAKFEHENLMNFFLNMMIKGIAIKTFLFVLVFQTMKQSNFGTILWSLSWVILVFLDMHV